MMELLLASANHENLARKLPDAKRTAAIDYSTSVYAQSVKAHMFNNTFRGISLSFYLARFLVLGTP